MKQALGSNLFTKVVQGDLSLLTPEERTQYYSHVCESLGLNPLTKPFDYIKLNGKLTLYAKRDCTDQLRKLHNISVRITSREHAKGLYIVMAQATDASGRCDESIGAVSTIYTRVDSETGETMGTVELQGDALANAIMKAETKAKRRVTLCLTGLGFLDETEVDSITEHVLPPAAKLTVVKQTAEKDDHSSAAAASPASSAPQKNAVAEGMYQIKSIQVLPTSKGTKYNALCLVGPDGSETHVIVDPKDPGAVILESAKQGDTICGSISGNPKTKDPAARKVFTFGSAQPKKEVH